MEQYLKNFKNCLQKEIPYCSAECPFQLDVLDFIEKMKRGGFQAAFKTYRNAVGFPLIASNLCHEPCKEVCPRSDVDRGIDLRKLEKACISFARDGSPTDYNLAMKKKKVAVIGAGLSGLACVLRLCMKKYEVELFEATERIGGCLWELLPSELFLTDIEEQLKYENYGLHLNTTIQSVEELEGRNFDAIYVATGKGGADFGLLAATDEYRDKNCAKYGEIGWFAGGGLVGDDPIYALANGLYMGTVIDNYLKTGNLFYPENGQSTGMCLNPTKLDYVEPVIPINGQSFNEEEAQREASRCIECQCDFCRTYCDLTEFYNKWPLRIRDEVMATTMPGSADIKATPAKRLMSTCSQCGLCKETCPEEIDLGGLILAGRKSMHQQKKAPWVFHDFWLRDMDFAGSEFASISRTAGSIKSSNHTTQDMKPTKEDMKPTKCTYAFFPGCQLGASDPVLVEKAYEYLLGKHADTALLLRCCGAPAEWSGDEEKHKTEIATLRGLWAGLGKPTLILACPTCEKKFKTYMADIAVISLYEIMEDWGVELPVAAEAGTDGRVLIPEEQNAKVHAVFDPCAARHEKEMKESVRTLAKNAGYRLEPLLENDAYARCCSFGGQPGVANPEYAEFVTKKRISESENPYITYCINCRDIFTEAGKEAVHILTILFGDGKAPRKLATISQRRENRIALKSNLLKEYWNTEMAEEKKQYNRKVRISEELAKKLSKERILEEDIVEVLDFCERTGRRVLYPDKGIYSGYREVGHMTYWVEYKKTLEEGSYELINAYAHRMKIELEAVWNGRKTNLIL